MWDLLWSSTLLMLGGLGIARLIPVSSLELRRSILLTTLASMLLLPLARWLFWDLGWAFTWYPNTSGELSSMEPSAELTAFVVPLLGGIWGIGTLLFVVRLIRGWLAVGHWLGCSRSLTPSELVQVQAATRLTGDAVSRLRVVAGLESPCVIFHGRVWILLPEDAFGWSRETLGHVLQHEHEHWRRQDAQWKFLTAAVSALWWWHPLVGVLARRAESACEFVCDAAAVRATGGVRDYVGSLLELAADQPGRLQAALPFAASRGTSLRDRVSLLLRPSPRRGAMATVLAWGLATGFVIILILSLLIHREVPVSGEPHPLQVEAEIRWGANPFPGDSADR